ncbi:MAG: ribosome silencing factor [Cellvibrio sp.]|jgi:ribosome-associated protein|nr:ribosome silencing factor [Cellvibrio sp.]
MSDLNKSIINALENLKGKEIVTLDVSQLSDVMDTLIIASGTSSRHARSLAENLVEETKKAGFRAIGIEGLETGDWVLVDYGDTVVHVMQDEARNYYELEKLWSMKPAGRQ